MQTDSYISKAVRFRSAAMRRDLDLELSHALFSSADVDSGSRFLLKTLAAGGYLQGVGRVLDLGCGVGTLALSLLCMRDDLSVVCRDRDALARDVTLRNAKRNGLSLERAERGLFLAGIEGSGERFDLLISNVPAKAGGPVLADFFSRVPGVLSSGGRAAYVLVNTLAEETESWIEASGAPLLLKEIGPGHTVFVTGRGTERVPAADPLAVYERRRGSFELEGRAYELSGYWGLPEFDTPAWDTEQLAWACERASAGRLIRSACLIEPGTGHLGVFLGTFLKPERLALLSRDGLALAASARNLAASGSAARLLESEDGADLDEASFDLLAELPDLVPGRDWCAPSWERASRLLKSGGAYVAAGGATELVRLDRQKPAGFRRLFDRKRKGLVVAAYEKT